MSDKEIRIRLDEAMKILDLIWSDWVDQPQCNCSCYCPRKSLDDRIKRMAELVPEPKARP